MASMFLDGMMSQIGISTQGSLDALRRQLGPGVDPLYDYDKRDSRPRLPKAEEAKEGTGSIDQLRRTLREVVGVATDETEQAEEQVPEEWKLSPAQIRAMRESKRPMSSFVSTTRDHVNSLAIENRFRAPPPGSYRPTAHLCEPRVKTPVFRPRDATHSRKLKMLDREVTKLKESGRPYEHLLLGCSSVELLDAAPERMRRCVTSPSLDRYTARPDMVKLANIHFHDSQFTDHVLDGDISTSMILRNPSWDFAKLSAAQRKDRETYFQPGPRSFQEVMLRYFPQLERIPAAAAEGFTKSAASKAVVSRCRPLHDADHAICVLGDAAHAVGGGSLGQGCSAALQDAAALASCLREGAQLNQALPDVAQVEDDDMQEWVQGREEALVSSIAAFSEQRAAEGWALLDLIELQSAAEVRASALVQGPLVFGFFLEQLGRGTLKPLADIGARLLEERLQSNRQSSAKEVDQFVTHLKFKPTMGFSPAVIFFLAEKAILGLWKAVLDLLGRSYSALVGRNQTWLALLRSARAAAGVTRISSVRKIDAFKDMDEDTCALWAANFTSQERLQEDVLVRQSAPPDQQSFFCILKGSCQVLREGAVVAELQVGHCFGEAALMLKVPSPVSIKATSDATLLVMKGQVFQDLLPKSNQKLRAALAKAAERYGAGFEQVVAEQEAGRKSVRRLLQDVVGSPWSWSGPKHSEEPLDLDKLLGTVGVESYVKGDVIALGCQRLRVLEQGTCNVIRGGRLVRSLKEGHFFGPDLAADERVVACDEKVRVCSFTNEATTSLGLLLNQTEVQDWQEAFS
ncbi:unnamed protein product [Effrenium voratum]|nr:unnamed protein product [Effrenium voratum]